MSQWCFSTTQADEAERYFNENGFTGFTDLLAGDEYEALVAAVNQAIDEGKLIVGVSEVASNNDCVFAHPTIMELARHPNIVRLAERLTGRPIELQHAKFNAKPIEDLGGGAIDWHQDYPFYPHSNFDLVSCVIHLDDENDESGPLQYVNGSHLWGPRSHVDDEGRFVYRCTDELDLAAKESTTVGGKGGFVTFHHCLTIHCSAPKRRAGHRRYVIFQYRPTDAVQLAGVVWRCTGMQVVESAPRARTARFPDGSSVELRGNGGRLVDVAGQLAPDTKA